MPNLLRRVAIMAIVVIHKGWHWSLGAAIALIGVVVVAIWHTFNYDRDYYIPVEEVVATESERRRLLGQGA